MSGADTGRVFFHDNPDQRRLVPRPRADLRSAQRRTDAEQAIVDWDYNAWGGKYPPFDLDDVIPTRIGRRAAASRYITRGCPGRRLHRRQRAGHAAHHRVLPAQPEPQPASRPAADRASLRDYLGVRNILWLGDGIVGDDTDGHIDDLTRFVDDRTVVTVVEDDPADENYEPLQETWNGSATMTRSGRPAARGRHPADAAAAVPRRPAAPGQLRELLHRQRRCAAADLRSGPGRRGRRRRWPGLFPGREVVGIDCTDLVWGLGAFHCVTQQWPALPSAPE